MTPGSPELIGRSGELDTIQAMFDGIGERGRALLVEGEPGIGKTALTTVIGERVAASGGVVVRISGIPMESSIPYAGLQMMLQPHVSALADLPAPQREALEVLLGRRPGEQPPALLVGMATLSLLVDLAARHRVLVLVEDLHWLDDATRLALWFIARRVADDRILVLMTVRPGIVSLPEGPLIERLLLKPLSFIAADALLSRRRGELLPAQRRRVLKVAAGNPLALIELTLAEGSTDAQLTLTARLEAAFAGRFAQLSTPARIATLAVCLDDRPSVAEALRAAGHVLRRDPDRAWIEDAERVGLLRADDGIAVFRHPLVRTAVLQSARSGDLAAATAGLIAVLDRERTIWLRARRQIGPDSRLAAELERLGHRRAAGGDEAGAAIAFRRAGDLTASPPQRAARLVLAAEASERHGDYPHAAALIEEIGTLPADAGSRARADWLEELLPTTGRVRLSGDLGPALDAIDGMRAAGDDDRALSALRFLATLAWGSAPDDTAGARIVRHLEAFGLPLSDPRVLVIHALARPLSAASLVLPHIAAAEKATGEDTDWMLGYALNSVGSVREARPHIERSLRTLRVGGHLQRLPHVLLSFVWNCYVRGDLTGAAAAADEAATISLDTRDPVGVAAGRSALAFIRSTDGTDPDIEGIIDGSPIARAAIETPAIRTTLTFARGMAALTRGDNDGAIRELSRILRRGDPAYHCVFAAIALPDLADAASRAGSHTAAREVIDGIVADESQRWDSPVLEASIRIARLLLCPDAELETAYDRASMDETAGTFTGAKVALAVGTRLRHARRIVDSRRHLMAALALFDESGAAAWADRARTELRAAGVDSPRSRGPMRLTPQEHRIAQLAASGLHDKEIARRLYLSPRTVGAHLHSVYRELAIGGREALADALARLP